MTTIKTKIRFVVQGQIDGCTFYDVAVHKSESAATKTMDRILKHCYPKWRGLDIGIRLIRRVETITAESEIRVFTTTPQGKVRSYLAELFVPSWLPKPIQRKLKEREIPGKGKP